MRFVPLAIQMLVILCPLAAADPFSALISDGSLETLRATGTVSASIRADSHLRLIPSVPSRDAIISEVIAARPTVGAELLSLITVGGEPADSPEGWLSLYNALHSVSTMRGITYLSVSRGRREVLFRQSYALDAGPRHQRMPDPVFTSIPDADQLYTLQEDGSFGRNTYREDFAFHGDHLTVRIENTSTISLFLVPLVRSGNLVTHVVLVPRGNEILFYGASYMRTDVPVGNHRSREESLMNRLLALEGWLQARLAEAPGG